MSCLFRSLATFVNGMDETTLRKQICDYMERNPQLIPDMSLHEILATEGTNTEEYVQSMRQSATWGGALEIKAFCEIYHVGVIVHVRQTGNDILFRPSTNQERLLIVRIEWQGCHYEPILSY